MNNYSFRINTDNSQTKKSFINNVKSANKLLNNYLSVNLPKDNNNNSSAVTFLKKQLSHKKSFVTECEWEQKSNKNISSINYKNSNKDMNFPDINNNERKIIESVNSFNSSTEQELKSNKMNGRKQDFNNIKSEIINRNLKKKRKK